MSKKTAQTARINGVFCTNGGKHGRMGVIYRRFLVESMNYTYMVMCNDNSIYTGWTNNLEKRMKAHNSGKGARYTRSRLPVILVYFEEFATKEAAMKREYELKQLTRTQKLKIIEKGKADE